jgi:hypothetical protein
MFGQIARRQSKIQTKRITFDGLQAIELRWFQFDGEKLTVAFPH